MTRDEWKNNKDFDRISQEMNGIFTEWPTPSEIADGDRGPLTAAGKNARMRIWNTPAPK